MTLPHRRHAAATSSSASHWRNCGRARYWSRAWAWLDGPASVPSTVRCLATDLLPPGAAGIGEQVGGDDPLDRLDLVPDGLGGLAPAARCKPERADLGLARAREAAESRPRARRAQAGQAGGAAWKTGNGLRSAMKVYRPFVPPWLIWAGLGFSRMNHGSR